MGLREWSLRKAISLADFARSMHEPVNVSPDGVELLCPVCNVPWPCEQTTKHTEHIARLREELNR